MVMTYAAQFSEAAEDFATTLALHNAAMDDMRKINGAYKARREEDAKEIEYQRNNLTWIIGNDDAPAADRAAAKQKLAQLEFHACLPTVAERADYQDARERAEKYAHELESHRDDLIAARKALKDAIAEAEKRTLQNEHAAQAWISTHLDHYPRKL